MQCDSDSLGMFHAHLRVTLDMFPDKLLSRFSDA
jgi:hypothetical protein